MKTLLVTLSLLASAPAAANPASFARPLPDFALDDYRGGFALPSGLDVTIAVATETRIDGQLVLRSVLAADQGPAVLTVQGRDSSGQLVNLSLGGGGAVSNRDGTIRLLAGPSSRLVLNGQDVAVSHLVGGSFGSVIANGASNRSIDVVTTIDLAIANSTPALLGSSLLRIEGLALDSTLNLTR